MRPAPVSSALLFLAALGGLLLASPATNRTAAAKEPAQRTAVPKSKMSFDDGDTIHVKWKAGQPAESIRILGIDAPEVQHLEHNLPVAQAFGSEAAGFLRGCLAVANKIELVRAPKPDPFGRTLGYLFLDGKNYSVLVVEARLAVESISHYGDNGFPKFAAAVVAAAKRAGPVAFEAPYLYRRRMRKVSEWLKAHGQYPAASEKKQR